MRSFPAAFRNVPGVIDDSTDCRMSEDISVSLAGRTGNARSLQNHIHSDFIQMTGLPTNNFVEYMANPERRPTILCVIYRAIMESRDSMYPAYYQ